MNIYAKIENLLEREYKCLKCGYSSKYENYTKSHIQVEHIKMCFCCESYCNNIYYNELHRAVYCCIQGAKKDYNEFCEYCQKRMEEMIAEDPESFRNSESWINLPLQ